MLQRMAVLALVFGAAFAADVQQRQRGLGYHGSSFVKSLTFSHKLRVCNAYPNTAALSVVRGKDEKMNAEPMLYKTCQDFSPTLKEGDKIEFRVGDSNAGTFSVSDLPNNDAVLLLIVHRHDTLSTAVSFESHVFASLLNAQVAIIDTYKGTARSVPKIEDDAAHTRKGRSDRLRYDSVVAVTPGKYQVVLEGPDGEQKAKEAFVAVDKESYILMRVGVEAQRGKQYPQELVVYPKSDPSQFSGSAAGVSASISIALLVAFIQ